MQNDMERQAGLIKQARRNAMLSQMDLAQRAGVSQALISELETGRRPIGKIMICKIAEALGISVDDLLSPAAVELGKSERNTWLIKQLREQERMPAAELAQRLGITTSCLHLLESGGAPVSNDMVSRISDALGIKAYEEGSRDKWAMGEARMAITKARNRSRFTPPPGQSK